MSYETINREEVIDLFRELMQPGSEFRVLRLLGDAKQGKSHFMTKVFPLIAQREYGACCAVVDLRSETQSVADILHNVCGLLGDTSVFPAYHGAYQKWMNRPRVAVTGLTALLSWVQIRPEEELEESRKVTRHLVNQFMTDLRELVDVPCVLFFDSVDLAKESRRSWLMDILLVRLSTLTHVRVVVAGRSVPEACGSYAGICRSYKLPPVNEEEAYITYCRRVGAELVEQSIRDLACIFDYKPGLFVDYVVPKFVHRGAASD